MLDLRHHGIRVAAILPGSVRTEFSHPSGRPSDNWRLAPEDIARVVVNLLTYPDRALSREMLVIDLVVGVLSLLAPGLAAPPGQTVASFYGGLPLIVVAIAALRGRIEGLITAAILIVTVLGTIVSTVVFRRDRRTRLLRVQLRQRRRGQTAQAVHGCCWCQRNLLVDL